MEFANDVDVGDQLERLFLRVLLVSDRDYDDDDDEGGDDDEGDDGKEDDRNTETAKQLAVYLGASLEEALEDQFASRLNWKDPQDWKDPLRTWLRETDEDAFELIDRSDRGLQVLIEGLFALYSLSSSPLSRAKFAQGDRVLAVLLQDQQWHQAKVEQIVETTTNEAFHYVVRFIEYGNPQTTIENDIAIDAEYLAAIADDDNACQICFRVLPLTFHHLVPRETHSRVLKRKGSLPPEIECLYENRPDKYKNKSRKDWLDVHGINVCRQCHDQVHRAETNMSLSLKFNSLERLIEHPSIVRWRSWACKQH